jgi:hypothetical protein
MFFEIKQIKFNNIIKDCISVKIQDTEYELCDEYSHKRWSNEKTGFYGGGMLNSAEDKHKTERIGLLGEYAFSKLFDIPVDFSYRKFGDDCDFLMGKYKIDVKTESKLHWYNSGLIYGMNEYGKKIYLKSDIYVFSYIEFDNRTNKNAIINIIGFELKRNIEKTDLVPGRKNGSKHFNYEVLYDKLYPISMLYDRWNNKKSK